MGNLRIRKKTIHTNIPLHPHAKRPHRLYFTTNPRWSSHLLRVEEQGENWHAGAWPFCRMWELQSSWENNRLSRHLEKMGHMNFWVLWVLKQNPLFCQLSNWFMRSEVCTWFGHIMLWGWKEMESDFIWKTSWAVGCLLLRIKSGCRRDRGIRLMQSGRVDWTGCRIWPWAKHYIACSCGMLSGSHFPRFL